MATKGFSIRFDSNGVQWNRDNNEKNPRWYYFEDTVVTDGVETVISSNAIRVYGTPEWEEE